MLECVIEIYLVQSLCDKRLLGSRWSSSRMILTSKAFEKIADVGD